MLRAIEDNDSYAVPIPAVQTALDILPYASAPRVMLQMLFYTGCRPSELDHMDPRMMNGNVIYWPPGKRQTGFRKEILPPGFLKELQAYREQNRVKETRLFGISSDTFRRYFNRDVRPLLGDAWNQKRLRPRSHALAPEYVLQLKGLRKTFQTLLFAKEWQRWGSSEVALEFTSKRMRHSSKHITVCHYLENFESLQISRSTVLTTRDALRTDAQTRVLDFSPC